MPDAEQPISQAEDSPEYIRLKALAETGDADAAYEVADMYDFGLGVAPDSQKAFKHYLFAARRGHAEAQFKLANRYDNGVGVRISKYESLTWYLIAKDNPALSRRSRYWANTYLQTYHSVSAMNSDAKRALLAKAERRAADWKPLPG